MKLRSTLTTELAELVRTGMYVDAVEGFAEIVGLRVAGGDSVGVGLNLDELVAAALAAVKIPG